MIETDTKVRESASGTQREEDNAHQKMEKVPEMEVEDVAFFCVAHVRLFETKKKIKNEKFKIQISS